jgi:hypothetical protein
MEIDWRRIWAGGVLIEHINKPSGSMNLLVFFEMQSAFEEELIITN